MYWAYYGKGNVLMMKNKIMEAIKEYTKSITINPQFYQAYISRGNAFIKLHYYSKAEEDYT